MLYSRFVSCLGLGLVLFSHYLFLSFFHLINEVVWCDISYRILAIILKNHHRIMSFHATYLLSSYILFSTLVLSIFSYSNLSYSLLFSSLPSWIFSFYHIWHLHFSYSEHYFFKFSLFILLILCYTCCMISNYFFLLKFRHELRMKVKGHLGMFPHRFKVLLNLFLHSHLEEIQVQC